MLTVENVTNVPYCVYGHVADRTCFYIGSGTLRRAFEFERDRGDAHRAKLQSSNVSVIIFSRYEKRVDALEVEREMIRAFLPECNIQHSNGIRRRIAHKIAKDEKRVINARFRRKAEWKRVYPIKCVETGVYFYGFAHAGRKMNICGARINAALHGRCSSADGYHFVRATWEESGLDRALIGKPKLQDAVT